MLDKQLWQKNHIKKISLKKKVNCCRNSDKCDKNIASVFKRQRKNGRIKIF